MNYPTYKRAKITLKEHEFEQQTTYLKHAKSLGLPLNPEEVYKDEWEGWEIYLTSLFSYSKPRKMTESNQMMDDFLRRPLTKEQ